MVFLAVDDVISIKKAREAFPSRLVQPDGSYRFGADALLLGAYASLLAGSAPGLRHESPILACEAGCGCGAALLAFAMACPKARCIGIEREKELAKAAMQNAASLGLSDRLAILECDLEFKPEALASYAGKMDLVLANPPWLMPGTGRLPANMLRRGALHGDAMTVFCKAAHALLRWHGYFCIIILPDAFCRLVAALDVAHLGLKQVLPVAPHENEPASRLLVMTRKQAAAVPQFLAPLVLHTPDGSFCAKALEFCPWLDKKQASGNPLATTAHDC